MSNLYPQINIDWSRGEWDPGYSDDAGQILMEMRDAFEGWTEEGFDTNVFEADDIAECQEMIRNA